MQIDSPERRFDLCDVEVETLRRAATERDLDFDPGRRSYTAAELSAYGLVRESYNSQELRGMGITSKKVVTSFDPETARARDTLLVDAPFANKIRKWQIPVDICEWRTMITEFPPDSFVEPHVHPANSEEDPGGSLRTILKGSISYAGRVFGPGDWFFIPNGVPYSFRSDLDRDTIVLYSYAFFAPAQGNRFSYPMEIEHYRVGTAAVA
ncbi:cupin domain-containing protein [Mesorhizobium sp. M0106]|uniref:cupin domain-containing protein n=1 Tax=Mesorhizobium sp. M0106 TaxID=2956880 RepID=UPI0033381E48